MSPDLTPGARDYITMTTLIQPSLDVIPAGLFRASLLPLHPIRNQPYLRIYYVPLTLPIIEDEN